MATFYGTAADETITADFVSLTVTRNPAGSFPSTEADYISAGNGTNIANGADGVRRDTDVHGIVGHRRRRRLLHQPIGRHVHDLALDHGRDALLEGDEPHVGVGAVANVVDVLGPDPRLDDEVGILGQDFEDRITRTDHGTDRVDFRLQRPRRKWGAGWVRSVSWTLGMAGGSRGSVRAPIT